MSDTVTPPSPERGGGIIRAFLDHKVAPNLVAVLLCLAGVVALVRLNTQFFPTVNIPTIIVSVAWPGASARDISEGVLDIVEPEVRFIDGIKDTRAYAVEGSVRLVLEFDEGTDMDEALSDVEQRVANITTLPKDAEKPIITRVRFYETVAQIIVSGPFAENTLQETAKTLRDKLLDAGIDKVSFTGKRDQEIWIELPPEAPRQLALTLSDVAERVSRESQNLPLGVIEGGAEKQVRTLARALTADQIGAVTLKAWETGARIRVRDVAVTREAHDDGQVRVSREGRPAIILDVQRTASADTLKSMRTTLRIADEVRGTLPPTLRLEVFNVISRVVDQRIKMLTENAIQGFTIVCVVLLLFLNVRVALWVAAGIPVAMLATFFLMWVSGQSINAVSLVALILVLGMIVDDAIVVGEHAFTLWQAGMAPRDAALVAARRMLIPILASTSTTQAAFFPMWMIGGVIGQILVAIPMVVVAALFASTLECFLTLPAHLRHGLEHARRDDQAPATAFGRMLKRARDGFDAGFARFRDGPVLRLINLAVRWRYVTVSIAIASLMVAAGMVGGGRVGFTFFPSPEPETIQANVTFSPGLSDATMLAALREIELAAHRAVEALPRPKDEAFPISMTHSELGQQGQVKGDGLARVEIELTPGETRSIRTDKVIAAWTAAVPPLAGVERFSALGRRGGPPGSDVDVRLSGAPLDDLKAASLELQDKLREFPGLSGITDDLPFGKTEVLIRLNQTGVAMGLTTDMVGQQIRAAYAGAVASRFPRGDEEVTVRVKRAARDTGLAGLFDLTIKTPTGSLARLGDIAEFEERAAFSVLQRRDGQVAVSVTADIIPGLNSADAVIKALNEEVLPELRTRHHVDWAFKGRAEMQRDTFADLKIGTIIALSCIFLILAFAFERWLQPLLVMVIIPFGFVGTVIGHWIMGFDLTLFSMVGLLGLSGILVNGSIVLVDRYNERLALGEEPLTAAALSAADRLRALALTTLTTVGGIAPLMFERSLQAQFLIPIAITLSFGLAGATLLVLFLVPAMIAIGRDIGLAVTGFTRWMNGPRDISPSA